jgi:polyribonucleotide nucleotidyltransferase
LIKISSSDPSQIEAAAQVDLRHRRRAEVGKIYDGKVVNIVDFGAFVNFMGGKDGLVHVSEMKNERVEKPTDVVSEGMAVKVKVLEIDQRGKVRLSHARRGPGHRCRAGRTPVLRASPRATVGTGGDRGPREGGRRWPGLATDVRPRGGRTGGRDGGRGGDRGPRPER